MSTRAKAEASAAIGYTITDASISTGIGRTTLYKLIGEGVIDARKVGNRTIVIGESLRSYLSGLPSASIRAPRQRAA